MTIGAALIQLLSAAIAGGLGGWFVLLGVNAQFRRQSEAACRALLQEVGANCDALIEMMKVPRGQGWPEGTANPGWLHHSVWDAQVHYVVQLLDPWTLALVVRAYAMLDSVPEMRILNFTGTGIPYDHSGWIHGHLYRAREAFAPARDYLENFVATQGSSSGVLPFSMAKAARRLQRHFPWSK
jgi:hypothetical protein